MKGIKIKEKKNEKILKLINCKSQNKIIIKQMMTKLFKKLKRLSIQKYYKREIFNTFKNFLVFLIIKNKHIIKQKILIKDIKLFCFSNYLNINTRYKKYSIIKKYLSMLNRDKLYYRKKNIAYKKNKNTDSHLLKSKECKLIIRFLKSNDDIEGLLCFYFLLIGGFNIYELSKLLKKNINNNNKSINYNKGKIKVYKKIPNIISEQLNIFLSSNNNSISNYLFFERIIGDKNHSRTYKIKNILMEKYSKIIENKMYIKKLMNYFSFHKKAKKLGKFGIKMFDINCEIVDGMDDENTISFFSDNVESNESY